LSIWLIQPPQVAYIKTTRCVADVPLWFKCVLTQTRLFSSWWCDESAYLDDGDGIADQGVADGNMVLATLHTNIAPTHANALMKFLWPSRR